MRQLLRHNSNARLLRRSYRSYEISKLNNAYDICQTHGKELIASISLGTSVCV